MHLVGTAPRRDPQHAGCRYLDVIPDIAAGVAGLATTRPYYRSRYMFVVRRGGPLDELQSLDDPRLRQVVIDIQLVGDDGANTPPVDALVARGIVTNVRGFMVYGNYEDAAPSPRYSRRCRAATSKSQLRGGQPQAIS